MKVENIQDITIDVIKQAVEKVTNRGLYNHALLGSAGDRIIIYSEQENNTHSRPSQISIRLHSSGVELLVTNRNGDFLFYGKFHPNLGSDFIATRFKETLNHIGEGLILCDSVDLIKLNGTKFSRMQRVKVFLSQLKIKI